MTANIEHAFWVTAPGQSQIRPQAHLGDAEVLVRSLYSGISRGSETLVYRGEVPPSQYERMRAPFQQGHFPAPVKYGYASVGEVESGPATLAGRIVFCLHPHQTRYRVPAAAVHPLPDGVPARRAVLGANMETAVNALWDGAPRVGDAIAVVGAGAVGCMVAWLCSRVPGCRVQLCDVNPGRAAIASALGVEFVSPAGLDGGADLVFHASGRGEGLNRALGAAGFEARVVDLSWYGTQPVTLTLGESFHSARLQIVSSQVGHVAPARRARREPRQRLALALSLLQDPCLDALITGESPFVELPQVMAMLADGGDALCHCITYD